MAISPRSDIEYDDKAVAHPGDLAHPAERTQPTLAARLRHRLLTRDGWLGDYDYAYLFTPKIPFIKRDQKSGPFFGLNDKMPTVLAIVLGFQHSLAMLAGVVSPALILSGTSGANLDTEGQQYLVSAALICCGLLSSIQITRFHFYKSPYYLGTGLISVVGTSFATIPVASGAFSQMYTNGYCPTDDAGNKLPCPDGYGALIGTTCICALFEILLSFTPPKILQKVFPPIVTGPTVLLIGVHLIETGFEDWAGGSGSCMGRPTTGDYILCPSNDAPHALAWGSAEFIGLGFLVFVTIILCEKFGSPIMQSCAVVMGLLVGCIVAGACGYFDKSTIDIAPAVTFIWVHTFKLSLYAPVVLPMLAVYLVLMMEAIGDITATCDVSRLEVSGREYESRIQGGVLADGFNGVLAGLMTMTPMSTFAQNNGVISLTKCANRTVGYFCCFFLVIMGVFSKFAAALVAIPSSVLGGMTTFLFCSVAVSGMRIVATVPFTRRNRFVLTASMSIGVGAILVPTWFDYVFTYDGDNHALLGFYNAITLIMETGFALTAFLALILNLLVAEDAGEAETPEIDAVAEIEVQDEILVQKGSNDNETLISNFPTK
ncbi:permease family-domain-containing protein [Limtongia smithiae]|uniref:permease family-domain-containing protein n=1 Tax=Limtongia smithiae TaxID=1125753 RepID=UPI0034D01097